MRMVADLHIHSRFSRATSKNLTLEELYRWSQLKGVTVLATGDFTHPGWFKEIQERLQPAEEGFFELKRQYAQPAEARVPPACRGPVRFVLGVEISSIYKKGGRVRKVHSLVFAPSFEAAEKINKKLAMIGNLHSDGRPILGLGAKELLAILLEISPQAYLIPAHAWTPHFAVFGSESGFDSLEECFDELTPHIFAIETGLSSDPLMNWRLSALDKVALISNSDAHSPQKLAREANILDAEFSYAGLFDAFRWRDPKRFLKTLEFFPEEGKYHFDGHRNCQTRLEPQETMKRQGLCPSCRKPVTVGVLHRVEKLADRREGFRRPGAVSYESLVPLPEVLSQILQCGVASKRVDGEYFKLLSLFGNELYILRELPAATLRERGFSLLAKALERMRRGDVQVTPGYDGEYGIINVIGQDDFNAVEKQPSLFDS